jgi:ribonucleotide reductase beta subunit family protein with ferritin-like domain
VKKFEKTDLIISDNIAGVNQILPHRHEWAWNLFVKGCANNWMPTEVSMATDISQWKAKDMLSEDERLVVKRCLGFFAGSESLVANNLLLSAFKYVTDPECRQYILRQAFEESVHNMTVVYVCNSLDLDTYEVYQAYASIPSIKAKDDFLMGITTDIARNGFTTKTVEGKREFLRNLISYYIVCEGIFFFSGFAMLLSFGRQNKLPGISEQIQYTLRDECVTPDTEFLTPWGWKSVTELNKGDLVAQYENGNLSFAPVQKLSTSEVDHVYRVSNEQGHVDLCVSENHRLVYETKDGNLKVVAAKDATYNPYCKHLCTAPLAGGVRQELTPVERFLIAMQADAHLVDGEYRDGSRCGHRVASFGLSKQRKIDRLCEIVAATGFAMRQSPQKDGTTKIYVDVPLTVPFTKTFNWFSLADKSAAWCKEFIDEAAEWDGHWVAGGRDRVTWGSVDKFNADMVQAVASLAGYRTHRKVIHDGRKESYSDYYRLQINKARNYIRGGSLVKERVAYEGKVYGVEVPSGFVLVRRNGAVAVTGNSLHIEFGVNLINLIREQNPRVWTKEFEAETVEHIKTAVDLEVQYARDVLPRGILGLNADMFLDYMRYIANRRLGQLNLEFNFGEVSNPFGWMSEVIDLQKQKNFFETRVTDYKTAQLQDDF